MGRKIRAAKASLVAAFVAAGGAATAKSVSAAPAADPAAPVAGQVNWGDQLIRFLKLDGFPAYNKADDFAQLTQFYKAQLLSDASALYAKYPDQVGALLDLYQKADAGPLAGILSGLETYWKADDIQPLLDYLKTPGALDAYAKMTDFFSALQDVSRGDKDGGALAFFFKETGIAGLPAVQFDD